MRRLRFWWRRFGDMDPLGVKTSIANRLRWSYFITSTLPILVIGALLLMLHAEAQREQIYNDQRGLASRVARDISRYISDFHQQIELGIRPNESLGLSFENLSASALSMSMRNASYLLELGILDEQGQERVRVHNLLKVPSDQLSNYQDDPAVRQALQQGLVSYSLIRPNETGRRSFIMTMPLRNAAGIVVGVVRAEINAEPLINELNVSDVSEYSYAYLVNRATGDVLLDNGDSTFTPPLELRFLLEATTQASTYIGARSQNVLGALHPINTVNSETDWAIVVEQPAHIALESVQRSVGLLTSLVLLAGFLALMWAFHQAKRLMAPLHKLREGAINIGSGRLDYRVPSLSRDEFGDVGRAFNQMASRLQESLAEIERRNERALEGLALARDIQIGLLPERPPWNGDILDVYACSLPAYEVGGDFYTYLSLPGGRMAIAIGDISGKGVGAALLMALTSSAVESQGREFESPSQVLESLNKLLLPRLKSNHMNTALLFAIVDPREGVMRIANAGMIAPMLISSEGCEFIEVGGLPIGSFAGAKYVEQTVPLRHGDMLLFLSDGVVEAHNQKGEMFGFERLEAVMSKMSKQNVHQLVDELLHEVQTFMGDAEQHDDITLVAMRSYITMREIALQEEQEARYATL
jgi:serine phosphatase RsbU (regulator of sigma subunit)